MEYETEISAVISAWNEAAQRLEQTHEVLHAEVRRLNEVIAEKDRELARKNRLADLGLMASHIAHEVRNGLVPVTLYLSLLRRRISGDTENERILELVRKSHAEIETTLNDLLHFASDREPQRTKIRISELAEEICRSLLPQFEAQKIEAFIDMPEESTLNADREMIRRAIMNLVLNGIDAMPDGGELCIRTRQSKEFLEIQVVDSGCGFTEESLRHANEPFFSTKDTGTGLGLAIVSGIMESHGAELKIANRPEGGAKMGLCFRIGN